MENQPTNNNVNNKKNIVIIVSVCFLAVIMLVIVMFGNKREFEVRFDTKGGTTITNQIIKRGDKLIKPEDPTKENAVFIEWQYKNEKYDFDKPVEKNIKLEAKWLEYELYEDSGASFQCYTASSVINNELFDPADELNNEQKIICRFGMETYQKDKISNIKFTLNTYDNFEILEDYYDESVKDKNKFEYEIYEPTSVIDGEEIVLRVKSLPEDGILKLTIENIKFVTEDEKHFYTNDVSVRFNVSPNLLNESKNIKKYKLENAFGIDCYTEKSIKANKFERVTSKNIKKGDKIVCNSGFEVYGDDKVTKFQYELKYGKGLKLINEKYTSSSTVTKNSSYRIYELKEGESVGEYMGEYTFEIIGDNVYASDELHVDLANIKFITNDPYVYYVENDSYVIK